ncbi:MAG: ribonuclease III [Pseudomonadota bacterium]
MSRPDTAPLQTALGHHFTNPALLTQALTHPSVIGTGTVTADQAYERLEFLGDRVLGLVIADMLLAAFPDEREGDVAKRHSVLVRRDTLAEIATGLNLGALIQAAPAESGQDQGPITNKSILADACEAVIAALYIDGGLSVARDFIEREWATALTAAAVPPQDAKTRLQEWAQRLSKPLPKYKMINRDGPDHAPIFTIEVVVADLPSARATGSSKQKAEQAAADAMLDLMHAAGLPE